MDSPWVQLMDIEVIVEKVNAHMLKYCHNYCSADSGERGCDDNCSICGSKEACFCCLPAFSHSETEGEYKATAEELMNGQHYRYIAYMKEINGVYDNDG